MKVVEFTLALQETGCFSVVLECVLASVAAAATFALRIPTIDDSTAIFMAFQSPQLEVLGLTTIFGNVTTEDATRNVLLLITIFNVQKDCEIVECPGLPMAEGTLEPLKPNSTLEVCSSTNLQPPLVTKATCGLEVFPAAELPPTGSRAADACDLYQKTGVVPQNTYYIGGNMRDTQFQTIKPSGLRMPSPSLGFFRQIDLSSHIVRVYLTLKEAVSCQYCKEHKYEIVRRLQARKHICRMTGDGVNDAPALKKADIGIVVAHATDAARSASDIVLTEPGLSVIISAVLTSRAIYQRMKNYTLGFMLLALIWRFDFPPFMVLIIAILNDGVLLKLKGLDGVGVIWLYNIITYIPLDFIKFIIRYAISGKAWDLIIEQRIAFPRKKDFRKEERELKWAHAQRTLHGLQPPESKTLFGDRNNMVGRGGYSEVYHGDLDDGRTIAVKRLTKDNTDENKEKEFLLELEIIGHVNHPNTAILVGCCIENGLHLIFNLSPNGTLASALFDFGLEIIM
ncbi:hypothetical protein LOK49_LG02G01199 [Camellia lanceoleosa]|uniref:Uncharacterized protein n=1 Tax=Camellia lanceoleosa TaxID=1840588 RepID=A0ACC0IMS3_9ERIC|nr:hypothetical protein LOK49_LG02G01199 [Camellia lanceoleosa]